MSRDIKFLNAYAQVTFQTISNRVGRWRVLSCEAAAYLCFPFWRFSCEKIHATIQKHHETDAVDAVGNTVAERIAPGSFRKCVGRLPESIRV